MVVTPLRRLKKVKKRARKFTRHEFEDYPHKLRSSWRKPRGIDSRVRRKFRSNKPLVSIGYGTDRKTRFVLPNGFKKILLRNLKDVELLLMNNRVYCGEIAANVSARKKKLILKRAAELNARVINAKSKLVKEEAKEN